MENIQDGGVWPFTSTTSNKPASSTTTDKPSGTTKSTLGSIYSSASKTLTTALTGNTIKSQTSLHPQKGIYADANQPDSLNSHIHSSNSCKVFVLCSVGIAIKRELLNHISNANKVVTEKAKTATTLNTVEGLKNFCNDIKDVEKQVSDKLKNVITLPLKGFGCKFKIAGGGNAPIDGRIVSLDPNNKQFTVSYIDSDNVEQFQVVQFKDLCIGGHKTESSSAIDPEYPKDPKKSCIIENVAKPQVKKGGAGSQFGNGTDSPITICE